MAHFLGIFATRAVAHRTWDCCYPASIKYVMIGTRTRLAVVSGAVKGMFRVHGRSGSGSGLVVGIAATEVMACPLLY